MFQYLSQENSIRHSSYSENSYISYQRPGSPSNKQRQNSDVEKGAAKEEKTKITKTYHTIKDMISSRFNKNKDNNNDEQKQMNNQTADNKHVLNGNERTYGRACDSVKTSGHMEGSRNYENNEAVIQAGEPGVQRVYGSRERLIDGFPNSRTDDMFDNTQTPVKNLPGGPPKATPRDTRLMPPLPVLRGNHHPNFSGVSEVISPITPSSPISRQQQQRRLANAQQQEMRTYEHENPYQRTEVLSHQQMQRKIQSHQPPPTPENHGNYSTARAHLVQTIEGSPQRSGMYENPRHYLSSQEPTYTTGSYLPPHQRRPPPNPGMKPVYRDLRTHPISDLSQSSPNLTENQSGILAANLESNGVYISKTPNPKFSHNEPYAYSQNPIYGSRPSLPPPANPEGPAVTPVKNEKKIESETDDDGGFKKATGAIRKEYQGSSRSLSGEIKLEEKNKDLEKENQEPREEESDKKDVVDEEAKNERPNSRNGVNSKNDNFFPLKTQDNNKVSSATSSDYEKATRRSLGQGSSLGDSGRGSAAYSSGRQESGRGSAEYSSGREKPICKERVDTSTESSDGIKRESIHSGYAAQKALPRGM